MYKVLSENISNAVSINGNGQVCVVGVTVLSMLCEYIIHVVLCVRLM